MRTLVTEIRRLENEHHVQPFLSSLHSQQAEEDPGVRDMEALIDTIQKQLKDHPCRDNIREAFQIYDKEASGYVDRETFFKICDSYQLPVDDSLIKEVSRSYFSGLIAEAGHCSLAPKGSCICILTGEALGCSNQICRSVLIMAFAFDSCHWLVIPNAVVGHLFKWAGFRQQSGR